MKFFVLGQNFLVLQNFLKNFVLRNFLKNFVLGQFFSRTKIPVTGHEKYLIVGLSLYNMLKTL